MEFHEAYWYLEKHPIFKGNFSSCLTIMVVKVDPKTNHINDDKQLNTKTEVWLECGDAPHVHDIRLDCGGDTFEKAIVHLAGLVMKHYGDYKGE